MAFPHIRIRRRTQFHLISAIVVLLLLVLDPDSGFIHNLPFGGSTIAVLMSALLGYIGVSLFNICRVMIFDYDSASFRTLLQLASVSSIGAGLAAVALAIMGLAIAIPLVGFTFLLR